MTAPVKPQVPGQQPQAPQAPAAPQAQGLAPAPQPTFAAMQQQGVARPAPQPLPPRQQAVQQSFNRMSREIDEQYDGQQKSVNEEMARRGLYDSNIAGDRMNYTNLQRRDAKSQMGDRLLERLAEDESRDRDSEFSRSMQREDMDFRRGRASSDDRYRDREFGEGTRRFDLGQAMEERVFGRRSMESDREFGEGTRRFDRDYDLRDRESNRDYDMRTRDQGYREREGDRRFDLDRGDSDYRRREGDRRYDMDREDQGYRQREGDRRYKLDEDRFGYDKESDRDRRSRDWWNDLGGLDYEDGPSDPGGGGYSPTGGYPQYRDGGGTPYATGNYRRPGSPLDMDMRELFGDNYGGGGGPRDPFRS